MSKRRQTQSDGILQPVAKKKSVRAQEFLGKYASIPGIVASDAGKTFAHCSYCKMDFLIAHSGKYDIDRHCGSKSHKDHASVKKAAAGSRSMADFIPTTKVLPEEQTAVRAEAMFAELIVKMNLPLSTADVISKTVKSAFPDSKTAQNYQCCRKKATAMIHQMSLDIKSTLKARIATGPFCVSTDGSNEQRDKQYPVVITTVGEFGVCTDLLSVPTMGVQSASTGENIFKLLEKELKVPPPADATLVGDPPRPPPPSVPWQNCMALGCDNAPVMTGHTNGVFGNMKTKQPHLYLSGCPCHLIHRAAQKAASELPLKIDEILVDIYFYFEHSSKRLAVLETFQAEVKNTKVLKHVATRWLSIRKCLGRILENWNALDDFFKQETSKTTSSSAKCRQERLKIFFQSRTNKLYCLFLHNALHPFDITNQQLQCEAPKIHILQRSLHAFMRDLLVKFVKPTVMAEKMREEGKTRPRTVLEMDFKKTNNHKQTVFLSTETEAYLTKVREEKVKEFHIHTKKFYVAACTYIKDKLPMKAELLKNAEVADVDIRMEVEDKQLTFFLTRFPCLLPAGCSVDTVKQEFCSYQSHHIIPSLQKERMDATWVAIGQTKDVAGVALFSNLARVMLGILTIPHSNAGCERVFSCVRKNRTDQRASLTPETMDSLMVVKSRPGMPVDRVYSAQELSKLKSACVNFNKKT